jgi:hypothetical protein
LFEAGAFRRTVFIVDAKSVHILSSICPPATAPGLCVTTAPQFLAAIRRFGMATFRRERGSVFIPIRKAL